MTTIEVTNIAPSTTEDSLREFFSYCGAIRNVSLASGSGKTQQATIEFEKASAATTASMLSGGSLDGNDLEIQLAQSAQDTAKTAASQTADAVQDTANQAAGAAKDATDKASATAKDAANKASATAKDATDKAKATANDAANDPKGTAQNVANQATDAAKDAAGQAKDKANEVKDGLLGQEDKPRVTIVAEYLAAGYQISDAVTQRAIDFDHKHGYSHTFTAWLQSLDRTLGEKLSKAPAAAAPTKDAKDAAESAPVTQGGSDPSLARQVQAQAQAIANHPVIKSRTDWAWSIFNDYYNKAINHPRIHDFYTKTTRTVQDVHEEAKRIQAQKQQQKSS